MQRSNFTTSDWLAIAKDEEKLKKFWSESYHGSVDPFPNANDIAGTNFCAELLKTKTGRRYFDSLLLCDYYYHRNDQIVVADDVSGHWKTIIELSLKKEEDGSGIFIGLFRSKVFPNVKEISPLLSWLLENQPTVLSALFRNGVIPDKADFPSNFWNKFVLLSRTSSVYRSYITQDDNTLDHAVMNLFDHGIIPDKQYIFMLLKNGFFNIEQLKQLFDKGILSASGDIQAIWWIILETRNFHTLNGLIINHLAPDNFTLSQLVSRHCDLSFWDELFSWQHANIAILFVHYLADRFIFPSSEALKKIGWNLLGDCHLGRLAFQKLLDNNVAPRSKDLNWKSMDPNNDYSKKSNHREKVEVYNRLLRSLASYGVLPPPSGDWHHDIFTFAPCIGMSDVQYRNLERLEKSFHFNRQDSMTVLFSREDILNFCGLYFLILYLDDGSQHQSNNPFNLPGNVWRHVLSYIGSSDNINMNLLHLTNQDDRQLNRVLFTKFYMLCALEAYLSSNNNNRKHEQRAESLHTAIQECDNPKDYDLRNKKETSSEIIANQFLMATHKSKSPYRYGSFFSYADEKEQLRDKYRTPYRKSITNKQGDDVGFYKILHNGYRMSKK